MGLREDALEAAENDRGTTKAELDDATIELRDKFAEWCAAMGIERVPSIAVSKDSYDVRDNEIPEMRFNTTVDDVPLNGRYVRGEKLRMVYADSDREINSLADLGRAVRADERTTDVAPR
jgi:hypothetical protein